MKKAKKDRDNEVTQAERLRAAKKSGIKAPTISRTQLQMFAANQDALNGEKTKSANKNMVSVGGVTPHYYGPYANYANSPQHLPTALIDFAAPGNVPGARKATGTAIVDNDGVITSIEITDPGSGYDPANPPAVKITGLGTGSGAGSSFALTGPAAAMTTTTRSPSRSPGVHSTPTTSSRIRQWRLRHSLTAGLSPQST
jgi:hypothetical protein